MNWRRIIVFLIVGSFFSVQFMDFSVSTNLNVYSEAISIDSDDDFITYAVSGNGSVTNPYIIADLEIASTSICIEISSTTKNFEIQNCTLTDSNHGIRIINVADGTATVQNCIINNHSNTGIYISNSDNVQVLNNTISYCYEGIYIQNSVSETIISNTFTSANVRLLAEPQTTIQNNEFFNCGLGIGNLENNNNYKTYEISNNSVNSKKLAYFFDLPDLVLNESYGQLFITNCTNFILANQDLSLTSTAMYVNLCENVEIRNVTVNNADRAIDLRHTQHFTLTSLQGSFTQIGIYAYDILNGTIDNCSFIHGGIGMRMHTQKQELTVTNSVFNDNYEGILIFGYGSETLTLLLENCSTNNCDYGTEIQSTENAIIKQNSFSNCLEQGLLFFDCDFVRVEDNICNDNRYGIKALDNEQLELINNTCNYNVEGMNIRDGICTILFNNCSFNDQDGMYLKLLHHTAISDNFFTNNLRYGVYLEEAYASRIYRNVFIDNNIHGTSQAYEELGNANYWYHEFDKEGNWWSDYSGSGNYIIDGQLENYDIYPNGKIIPTEPITTTTPIITTEPTTFTIDFSYSIPLILFTISILLVIFRKRKK